MAKPHFSVRPYEVTIAGDSGNGGGSSMRFISGEGEPGSDVGAPGDAYLDTNSGDLYTNKNGSWTEEMNLKGPKGDTGSAGKDGEDGVKGDPGEDGADGKDGFPSEDDWDSLVARVEALEE